MSSVKPISGLKIYGNLLVKVGLFWDVSSGSGYGLGIIVDFITVFDFRRLYMVSVLLYLS